MNEKEEPGNLSGIPSVCLLMRDLGAQPALGSRFRRFTVREGTATRAQLGFMCKTRRVVGGQGLSKLVSLGRTGADRLNPRLLHQSICFLSPSLAVRDRLNSNSHPQPQQPLGELCRQLKTRTSL